MIGTINSWVSKVVDTVSGPFSAVSYAPKKAKKVVRKAVRCKHKGKCKC
jgi:hypothetical protein